MSAAETIEIELPPYERSRDDQAWARWLARSADALLLMPAVFIAFAALGVAIELGYAPIVIYEWLDHRIAGAAIELVATLLFFCLWEPLFLSSAGTTPGKWIMGIRVRRNEGEKLSFFQALNRFCRVWFVGMGAGVPLLSLILMLMARAKFAADGVTAWDQSLDVRVEHRRRHPVVWVLVIVVVFGLTLASRIFAGMAEQGY